MPRSHIHCKFRDELLRKILLNITFTFSYFLSTAMRSVDGKFYFNKNWDIDPSGDYDIAGTKFKYQRGSDAEFDPEYLSAEGPTTEDVYVTVGF